MPIATPVFDGCSSEIKEPLATRRLLGQIRCTTAHQNSRVRQPLVTCATLKLNHLVDDRCTRTQFSLVIQQLVQFGGHVSGEMEMWALKHMAQHTLASLLFDDELSHGDV